MGLECKGHVRSVKRDEKQTKSSDVIGANVFPLRCFDTVFQRPYRYFLIALEVVFSLYNRYKIFTSNWLSIEICENVVLSKIDITMTTMNKKL